MQQWLDERLLLEKRRCDTDLSLFVLTMLDPLIRETADPQGLELLCKMKDMIATWTMLTPHQLKTGSCEPLVDQLQNIQLRWENHWHAGGRSSITKALLIISRVARVVAQLDQKPDPYEAGSAKKRVASPLSATMSVLPSVMVSTPAPAAAGVTSSHATPIPPHTDSPRRAALSKSYTSSSVNEPLSPPVDPADSTARKKRGGFLNFFRKLTRSSDKSPNSKRLSGSLDPVPLAPLSDRPERSPVVVELTNSMPALRPKSVDLRSDQSTVHANRRRRRRRKNV